MQTPQCLADLRARLPGILIASTIAWIHAEQSVAQVDDAVAGCDLPSAYSSPASWVVSDENDTFGLSKNPTDRFYTQGFRLTRNLETVSEDRGYEGIRKGIDSFSKLACRHRLDLPGLDKTQPLYRGQSVFFGQHIFTPVNIRNASPILDDRPYAAWLYAGIKVDTMELPTAWLSLDHEIEVQVGMVGPMAQGKFVQSRFHKWIESTNPEGWGNQLKNEPGMFAAYRLSGRTRPWRSLMDTVSHVEVALGNIETSTEAGVQLRLGRNLGAPFSVFQATQFDSAKVEEWWLPHDETLPCLRGRYLFAIYECGIGIGIQGRAVARNIFLDGNSFRDSQSVDREPFLYEMMVGARLRWKYAQMDMTFVRRSQEFSPVPSDAHSKSGMQNYGAVSLHCLREAGWVCPGITAFLLAGLFAH